MTEDTGQDYADSAGADGTDEPDEEDADVEEQDDVVARVAAHDEELAGEVATLRERVEKLEAEVEDREAEVEDRETEIEELTDRLQRTKADFQNYKKRAEKRREEAERQAAETLVGRFLDVRDNLQRALDQEEGADIRPGVEATLRSFDDALAAEDVEPIDPDAGDDLDPDRHEALQRVEADQPPGTVVDVYRTGYEMEGAVLRPAQVTVAEE